MDHPGARILVMAKAPVAGRAKTRLEPLLGPAGCARLQEVLVRHTVATVADLAPVYVAVAGARELVGRLVGDAPMFDQCDGDLGQRMTAAIVHVRAAPAPVTDSHRRTARLAAPYRPTRAAGPADSRPVPAVVVVGTDCPQLSAEHVGAALARVAAGDDVAFGPARDGGYYLVALAASTPAAPVFALPADAWGGPEVLELSLAAAQRAGLRAGLIGVEHDLDTPDDAAVARADPRVPPHIAALLHAAQAAR